MAKDDVEACKWLTLARAQGDDLAPSLLNSPTQRMTPKQIAEADRLAKDFKPRKTPEPGASPFGQPPVQSEQS